MRRPDDGRPVRSTRFCERTLAGNKPLSDETYEAKDWVRLAQAAELEAGGCAKGKRIRILERLARETGLSVSYLRRALTAYKHVSAEAPRRGLKLTDVRAPISSIETIKRIAKLSPGDAEAYYRRALLGDISYSALLSLNSALEIQARDEWLERTRRLDRGSIAARIIDDLAELGSHRQVERAGLAHVFQVDLVFEPTAAHGGQNAAAFISPFWKAPRSRPSLDEVCAMMLAASLAFSRVYYVAYEAEDWKTIHETILQTRADSRRIRSILPVGSDLS